MERILLMHPLNLLGGIAKALPGITTTANLEQVYAMVTEKQVGRICIVFDTLTESPAEAVKKIHALDPSIPIQVWDGGGYKAKAPAANETFLDVDDVGSERFITMVKEFLYEGFYC